MEDHVLNDPPQWLRKGLDFLPGRSWEADKAITHVFSASATSWRVKVGTSSRPTMIRGVLRCAKTAAKQLDDV
jgi:hypothetical protein